MPFSLKSDLAAVLAKLIKLSNSNTQYEFKVNSFLSAITWELDLEYAILLTVDMDRKILEPTFRSDLPMLRLSPMGLSENNIIVRSIRTRQTLLADHDDAKHLPCDWATFTEPFKQSFLVTPLTDDRGTYGALVLLARRPYEAGSAQSTFIEAVGNEMTIAIKNMQMATITKKRMSVLNVLSDLGRSLSSTIDPDKIMAMIPKIATGVFLAEGCTLNILDDSGRTLIMNSQYGVVPPAYNFERYEAKPLPPKSAQALRRQTSFSGFLKDDPKNL
ncbi:MAG: GAF domain-containing protein, partial [Candidatus Adiutrix sp.]